MHGLTACHLQGNFCDYSWKYQTVNKQRPKIPHLVALQGISPGRERPEQIGSMQKATATAVPATGQQTNKAIQFPGL